MKTKVSPAVVGLFVLGALVLGLIALFSFGGVNFFSKPERFVVYFDESIHGLDLGSPVKLRGVRVGRVVDIGLRYAPGTNQSVVAVSCELNRNLMSDEKGILIDVGETGKIQELVDRGLRAQLGVIGLATGLLFVELDFVDPKEFPSEPRKELVGKYVEMPAIPSAISQLQQNITEILNDLKKIDFAALSKEVQGLLVEVRLKVAAVDAGALVTQWTKTGSSVQQLVESPELKASFVNMSAATAKLDSILGEYQKSGPTGAGLAKALEDVRATVVTFNATAATVQKFVNAQQSLGDDASQALTKLGEAAAAVRELADYLERNPSALLTGRRGPQAAAPQQGQPAR